MNSVFRSILDNLCNSVEIRNMVTRLIVLNVVVFVLGWLAKQFMGENPVQWLELKPTFSENITHPWNALTYSFVHQNAFALLFNMINLAWAGRIVGDLLGDRRILPIYVLSGILGGLFYFAQARLFPSTTAISLGASAASMGLIVTAAMILPESRFFGPLKTKHVAMIFICADLIFVFASNGSSNMAFNPAPLSRLGGALMGFLYMTQLRNGIELGRPIINFVNKIRGNKPMKNRPRTRTEGFETHINRNYTGGGAISSKKTEFEIQQNKLDQILEKIKKSGYDSLSEEEKDFLAKASQQ